jgi:hypothetical protein
VSRFFSTPRLDAHSSYTSRTLSAKLEELRVVTANVKSTITYAICRHTAALDTRRSLGQLGCRAELHWAGTDSVHLLRVSTATLTNVKHPYSTVLLRSKKNLQQGVLRDEQAKFIFQIMVHCSDGQGQGPCMCTCFCATMHPQVQPS